MTHWYAAHGLTIRSERPLPNVRPCPPGPHDLALSWHGEEAPAPPRGDLVASFDEVPGRGLRVVRTADGHHVSVHGVMEAELDASLTSARVRPWSGADPGLVEVLVGGFLLAAVLLLRGDAVLHASAVDLDGRAVALLGDSGAGKSTVLTLLVSAGALLLSDDLLTFQVDEGVVRCRAGSTETRLRSTAADLAARVPGAAVRWTADGRLAWSGRLSGRDLVPLDLVLLLQPSSSVDAVQLEPVRAGEALARVVSHPRVPGWHGGDAPRQQLAHAAALARSVPMAALTVPWGPPFPDRLGADVLSAVRRAVPRTASGGSA